MNAPYLRLSGRDEIVAAADGHPFVSCFVAPEAVGFQRDETLVWNWIWGDDSSLMAFGEPERAARLLQDVMAETHPSRLTIPVEVYDLLPEDARPPTPNRWRWFYTRAVPELPGVKPRGEWLDGSAEDEITELLTAGFPGASNWPGPARGSGRRRWFGVRDDDGSLAACGLASTNGGEVPNLASICVHPDARGRGLASDMTTWVTARLLDEGAPLVALGSYVSEEATHRLYRRLGYRDVYVLASGRLRPEE
ncbi:GNAT family N-acetyltransferase [Stackebrandtia soli]|uniref:GNAT family N-acetyltransferase n=1 Tax=Stackebrandtia soli TaxID=1892856 RepID=UPI0039E8A62F